MGACPYRPWLCVHSMCVRVRMHASGLQVHAHKYSCTQMVLQTFICWMPRLCCTMHTCGNGGSACRQASLCHAIMYTNMCLFEYAFLCMYVHWHVPMCAPVLVTVWVNSRHEYTLNSRPRECPYYCVYRHISEGMLSHGHMFISEECENACMITLVCVHMCLCVTWSEWRQIIPAWYHLTSC